MPTGAPVADGAFLVRPARSEEASALGALAFRAKAHWGYDATFMEACRAALSVPPTLLERETALVAEVRSGGLLGFGTLVALDGTSGEIDHLFVEPATLGRGVGRALLAALLAAARARGFRRIEVLSDPHARGFYERVGFRFVGMAPSDVIPGRDLPLLEHYLWLEESESGP